MRQCATTRLLCHPCTCKRFNTQMPMRERVQLMECIQLHERRGGQGEQVIECSLEPLEMRCGERRRHLEEAETRRCQLHTTSRLTLSGCNLADLRPSEK